MGDTGSNSRSRTLLSLSGGADFGAVQGVRSFTEVGTSTYTNEAVSVSQCEAVPQGIPHLPALPASPVAGIGHDVALGCDLLAATKGTGRSLQCAGLV
jgi:hypothetical protein